jgi:hypothetical protein
MDTALLFSIRGVNLVKSWELSRWTRQRMSSGLHTGSRSGPAYGLNLRSTIGTQKDLMKRSYARAVKGVPVRTQISWDLISQGELVVVDATMDPAG